MRNYDLIKKIYDRCPNAESFASGGSRELSKEQLFDRCVDIVDMIERERPKIAKESRKNVRG